MLFGINCNFLPWTLFVTGIQYLVFQFGVPTEWRQYKITFHRQFRVWDRDRPFNLKGAGVWFFVSFRIFFSDNTRVRIFFLSRQARKFFQEFNIRLYVKNSESDYFFSSTKIRIFFSATLGIRIYFLEKKYNPSLQVKWSFP